MGTASWARQKTRRHVWAARDKIECVSLLKDASPQLTARTHVQTFTLARNRVHRSAHGATAQHHAAPVGTSDAFAHRASGLAQLSTVKRHIDGHSFREGPERACHFATV